MSLKRLTNIMLRKFPLREFSALADSIDRLHLPDITFKRSQRLSFSQKSDSGSSDKKKKNPCELYKKVLDKRRKMRQLQEEDMRKKKDEEQLKAFEKKCINDEIKAWDEEAKSLSKHNKELIESLMQCVSRGIKNACKRSAKRKLCNEKELEEQCILMAKRAQIKKLLKKCESMGKCEKIDFPIKEQKDKSSKKKTQTLSKPLKTQAAATEQNEIKKNNVKKEKKLMKKKVKEQIVKSPQMLKVTANNKKQNSEPGVKKNPYLLELEKCIENEWNELCKIRNSLTKREQERLARAYNCLASQFRVMCKKKVLEQMCSESGTRSSKQPIDTTKKDKSLELEIEKQKKILEKEVQKSFCEEEAFIKHEVENVKMKCFQSMCEEAELQNWCGEEALKKMCLEKKKQREEAELKRKCELKKVQELKAIKKKLDEEKRKKKWEEIVRKKKRDEECKKKREEELKNKCEEEALKKRCREKALEKKRKEEVLRKKCKEEEALKKKQQEAALKNKEKEEALKKKQGEEAVRKNQKEEEVKKRCEEEALKKKCEEEALKKKCEEEALKKKCEEEALKKKCEEEALKKEQQELLKQKRKKEALKKEYEELKKKRKAETIKKKAEAEKMRKEKALKSKCEKEERIKVWLEQIKKKQLQEENLRKRCEEKALKKDCKEKEKRKEEELEQKKLQDELKEQNEKLRCCLFKTLDEQDFQPGSKVSIIGAGTVGMACAITLLTKGVTNNITLYDSKKELLESERLDLMHGSLFLNNLHIDKGTCIKCTKNSRVVVVTTGARPQAKETRLDVAQRTADIIKQVMPELVKHSPKAVFIIIANPADVMTWLARKITDLPYERCFSAGCHLDTARFRMFVAQILRVSAQSVHGYIIGEHGNSSVPLWSTVTVGGILLNSLIPDIGTETDPMRWSNVHQEVVTAAKKVSKGKGYTNWAIGLTITDIISAIFEDSNRVMSLSTNAKNMCGIEDEIFLSLPCIVNKWGLHGIIHPQLSEWELKKLHESAEVLLKAQCNIKI